MIAPAPACIVHLRAPRHRVDGASVLLERARFLLTPVGVHRGTMMVTHTPRALGADAAIVAAPRPSSSRRWSASVRRRPAPTTDASRCRPTPRSRPSSTTAWPCAPSCGPPRRRSTPRPRGSRRPAPCRTRCSRSGGRTTASPASGSAHGGQLRVGHGVADLPVAGKRRCVATSPRSRPAGSASGGAVAAVDRGGGSPRLPRAGAGPRSARTARAARAGLAAVARRRPVAARGWHRRAVRPAAGAARARPHQAAPHRAHGRDLSASRLSTACATTRSTSDRDRDDREGAARPGTFTDGFSADEALDRSPELAAARLGVRSAATSVRLAKKSFYPDLEVGAGIMIRASWLRCGWSPSVAPCRSSRAPSNAGPWTRAVLGPRGAGAGRAIEQVLRLRTAERRASFLALVETIELYDQGC